MQNLKGAAMSQKSIVKTVLLLVVILVVAVSFARVSASWGSGTQVGASWVDGAAPVNDSPDDAPA
jgi:autotransporter translocation and assembly factor TamB